jgi:hypothetical protein
MNLALYIPKINGKLTGCHGGIRMSAQTMNDIQETFERDGFVIIPDLFNSDEMDQISKEIDGALAGTIPPDLPEEDPQEFLQWEVGQEPIDGPERADLIRVLFHLCHTRRFFYDLIRTPKLLDVVEALIGPDITLYTDQMFAKPARRGSEVPYHHDASYWPHVEPRMISCWLAVDDVTVENGCVRYLPGTHLQEFPHEIHETDNPNKLGVKTGLITPDMTEVPAVMSRGSLCVHHSLTVHYSKPNLSERSRRGLVMIFLPSDIRFLGEWNFQFGFNKVR